MQKITGENQYTVYDGDNYLICKYILEDGTHATVVGNLPNLKNIPITCYGEWVKNPKFGLQFKSEKYEIKKPSSEKGIIAYIASLHCGVGKVWAKRIYDKFGANTWEILENTPEKLLEIDKFGENRLDMLTSKLNQTKIIRDIMTTFENVIEITPQRAEVIAKVFGNDAVDIIHNKPYKLLGIKGLGFFTVEEIAKQFNADPKDFTRIKGGMFYILEEMEIKGHSCVLKDTLIDKMHYLLNKGYDKIVSKELCRYVIDQCITYKYCYSEKYASKDGKTFKELIFTPDSYEAETSIAKNLHRIYNGLKYPFDENAIDEKIEEFCSLNTFKLAKKQKEAIKIALTNPLSIVTGGPGTGKSTFVKALLWVYKQLYDKGITGLLAPTGRASRRLAESTGNDARTIHSSIGLVPGENGKLYANIDKLDNDIIIIDEMSMTDQYVMKSLLETVRDNARVVFIGDPYQLPSVGAGNVLSDLIQSGVMPVTKLRVIFRQNEDSLIIPNSQSILEGNTDLKYGKGFYHQEITNDRTVLEEVCKFYVRCCSKFGIDNVVLLTPFREKTKLSVREFNKQLQHYYNPPVKDDKLVMKIHDIEFRAGDKIMQTKNTEHALNGDIGYIREICYEYSPKGDSNFTIICKVEFNNDGEIHSYTKEDMQNVDLAYATTVHKSQGSEYKTVLFVASMTHKIALKRNLLYTAITRSSENVAIFGEKEAIDYAINNIDASNRVTYLRNRLRNIYKEKPNTEEKIMTGLQLSLV